MDINDINAVIKKYERYFFNDLQVTLGSLPAKMCPMLVYDDSDECYTDDRIINIGKRYLKGETEDSILLEILWILGHEAQHILSTPRKQWSWGLEHGVETLASEMCLLLNGYRLKGMDDVKAFCRDAQRKGYGTTLKALKKIVHHVVNSVEDGRIEAIAAKGNTIFRDQMYLQRILRWQEHEVDKEDEFVVILNNILTVATMSMYQKGFLKKYAGTDVEKTMERLFPYISEGTRSRNCQGCMVACQSILKIIAPMCLEYFKGNKDADDEIEENGFSWGQSGSGEHQNSYHGDSDAEVVKGNGGSGGGSAPTQEGSESTLDNAIENGFSLFENKGIDKLEKLSEKVRLSEKEIEEHITALREQALNHCKDNLSEVKRYGTRKIPVIKEYFDKAAPVTADILKGKKSSEMFSFKELKQSYTNFLEMPNALENRARKFAHELERIFEAENIPAIENRLSGSLNTKEVYKLAIGELDFWKREEEEGDLDTVAYFLCDNSGSMGYGRESKREYALSTLAIIEEGFKRYMPLKIVAFQQKGAMVVHDCIKNFDEVRAKSCSFNFLAQGPGGSCNADGYSIRIATEELKRRPESKKILFVLSDGLPAYLDGEADTALAAKEARDAGIILVPIYFGNDSCSLEAALNSDEARSFADIYQKNFIITIPEEVEGEVIRLLKRLVI